MSSKQTAKDKDDLLALLLAEEGIEEEAEQKPKIGRAERSVRPPLSFSQELLWLLHQLMPNTTAYNVRWAMKIQGDLDVAALQRSLDTMIERHEVLRTTFATENGDPYQLVHESATIVLEHSDARTWTAEAQEAEIQKLLRRNIDRPWSFERDIIHGTLLRLRDDEHLLLLELHHIYCDGWSRGIFFRELSAVYDAYVTGKPNPLPPLPIQYMDFAIWQRAWRDSDDYEKQITYWKKRLTGAPALLEMPTDRPRPPMQTYRGSRESVRLDKALTQRLRQLAKKCDATLFMLLLAAFKTLLYRYTGQDDVVVGSPIANRNKSELEPLIGFFVNAVILRDHVPGDMTFADFVKRVRDGALEAYENQDVPYEKLVIELKPDRDLSYTPLFQVMFILQNVPKESRELTGLTISTVEMGHETAKFDLTLSCTEVGDEINAIVGYNVDLFDAETIQRFLVHYRALLEAVVAAPDLTLDRIPFLAPDERELLTRGFNQTDRDYGERRPAHEIIAARAAERPDAIAVVYEEDRLTYAELDRRANKLAHHIQKLGAAPESLIGISCEKSVDLVVGVLAIMKAGCAYVPIDPNYPTDRIQHLLEDSRAPVLLTQDRLVSALPAHSARVIRLDADWPAIEGEPDIAPPCSSALDKLAYAIFTSGSTGKSKGVLVEHGNLLNQYLAWEEAYRLKEIDSHLQMASMSFDVFTGDFVRALCSGAKLVLCSRDRLLDASKIVELIQREKIQCAEFVPAVLRTVIQYLEEKRAKLDTFKLLVAGSDVWQVKEYKKFRSFIRDDARLASSFGLTETTIDSTYYESADPSALPPEGNVPIGRPFANTRIYLVNKALEPVPVGVRGEIYIGGLGVARGYLNRPDLTRERFVPDTLSGRGGRLYKAGDVGRWLDDGNIEFLGRSDHQVKLRGYRVELGEIETVMTEHPAVRQAVVMIREDHPGQKRLVGYVVGRSGAVDIPDLKAFLKGKLPDYMVPSNLLSLDMMPVSPNGKVDTKELPRPEDDKDGAQGYVAPRDLMEMQLAGIWERVLDVRPISVTDNFFEVGGHSLLAVKLINEISKLGKTLPLASLFQLQTIEEQARFLGSPEGEQPWPTVLAVNPRGSKLPLFCVARPNANALGYIALSRNLGKDQPMYGLQSRYREEDNGPYELSEYKKIAEDYVREMKKVQPKGPYQLTGMCEGAHIAFEMVRLLVDAGDEIQMFATLDAWPVENTRIRWLSEVDRLTRPVRLEILPMREMNAKERVEYLRERSVVVSKRLASALMRRVKRLAKRIAPAPAKNGNGQSTAPEYVDINAIFARRYFPGSDWVPPQVPCRIHLIRVPHQLYYRIKDPLCGWGLRTTKGVTVYHVDSRHNTLLREPYVREVAARLSEAMSNAAREYRPPAPAQTPPKQWSTTP